MTAPLTPKGGKYTGTGKGTATSSGSSGGSSNGKSSAQSSADSQYAWSKNHQLSQENKAQRTADAGDKASLSNLLSNAGLIQKQIEAIKVQLGSQGFRKALNIHLDNALRAYTQNNKTLMEGYNSKYYGLAGSAADNERAAGDQSFANTANRIRERNSAVANTALHGAGETDTLRAQQMSLRNWDANQNEVARSYFDTLRSTNNSLRDLNADTKTARVNAAVGLNQQRGQLWDQYYSNQSQAWAQVGNLYGQRAQDYAQASGITRNPESGSYLKSNPYARGRDANERAAASALRNSGLYTGKAYKDPGVSDSVDDWQGHNLFARAAPSGPAIRANSAGEKTVRPSGASLRKWDD